MEDRAFLVLFVRLFLHLSLCRETGGDCLKKGWRDGRLTSNRMLRDGVAQPGQTERREANEKKTSTITTTLLDSFSAFSRIFVVNISLALALALSLSLCLHLLSEFIPLASVHSRAAILSLSVGRPFSAWSGRKVDCSQLNKNFDLYLRRETIRVLFKDLKWVLT